MKVSAQIREPIEREMVLFEKKFHDSMKSQVPLLNRITYYIVNRKGKPIMRYGRVANHRPAVRKAYVKLAPGSKNLEFFEGV